MASVTAVTEEELKRERGTSEGLDWVGLTDPVPGRLD
jgi:hypothetical protein